ncbi:carboxylating nicotinate-nucleotide diphosphorylase [Nitratidesulfovibrio termitidis]|uniref:carboxylating nicotinate-nucleotide diphosphorylase n=1 Tax=Nitratidesulfovibrio termitidis TaxID=42252 RepID=UPI0004248B9E|nr:carboxylating nicotinate-nucleotide diphosphorylase [Nitratidesulfovibrio termitidis]
MSSHTVPDFDTFFAGQPREHLLAAIDLALLEDGPDLTSDAVFGPVDRLAAQIVAKQQTLVAGLPVAPLVMERCASLLESPVVGGWTWTPHTADGDELPPGSIAADIEGPARLVLKAERVILNFVCHLSGIANLTRRYARELDGTSTRLLDTRKTLPGLRFPEKYAVLVGGGQNHRRTLAEMLMLKDNHIDAAGSITAAVAALRAAYATCPPIEVECRTLDEVREAVASKVDRIMLDNMDLALLRESLTLVPPGIETEASGGVTLETLRQLAEASPHGPDFVSVGRLTHSAPVADFSMRIRKA